MDTLTYIQNRYPKGIRNDAFQYNDQDYFDFVADPTTMSTVFKYDQVRSMFIDLIRSDVMSGLRGLMIQTADEKTIVEWENFLLISPDTTISIEKRRANILALITGFSATKGTIRRIVLALVGGNGDNVSFYERYHNVSPTELDLWTYEIHIKQPTTNPFSVSELFDKVTAVHPTHANLILVVESPYSDTIGVNDSMITYVNSTAHWGNPDGTPDGAIWAGNSPIGAVLWA